MTPKPTVSDTSSDTSKEYYSIGEVAQLLGIPAHSIRFWEKKFPSLHPQKNKRGVRRYSQTTIDQIRKIFQLVRKEGYTLKGAKEALKQSGISSQKKAELIRILKSLRVFLVSLREKLEE